MRTGEVVMAAPALNDLSPAEEISDESLIERIVLGDEAAFELLYDRYYKRVYRFTYNRLHNREDTEETVQDVFTTVFSSVGSFRGESAFSAWVLGVTRRTIASRFKKKRHATVPLMGEGSPDETELANPTSQRQPTPLEVYEYVERVAQLTDAAENDLTPGQRRLFELHHLEEQSIRELAETLCKSQDAVKSNLYRARKILLAR